MFGSPPKGIGLEMLLSYCKKNQKNPQNPPNPQTKNPTSVTVKKKKKITELLFGVDGVVYYGWHFHMHSHTHVTVKEAECLSTLENLALSLVFKCFLELWK